MNRQGTSVAYLVKAPDINSNTNNILLYVRATSESVGEVEHLLANSRDISQLQWLGDGRHVVVLMPGHSHIAVTEIDMTNGKRLVLAEVGSDIAEYSIDADGKNIAFTTKGPTPNLLKPSEQDIASGYRIPFRKDFVSYTKRYVFLTTKSKGSQWSKPRAVIVRSTFTGEPVLALTSQSTNKLQLSPDGKLLLLSYISGSSLPEEWLNDPHVRVSRSNAFPGTEITVLCDLVTGKTTMPLKTPWTKTAAVWSPDSRSFMIFAQSPIGSAWAHEDEVTHLLNTHEEFHVFWVNLPTEKVELVPTQPGIYGSNPILAWTRDDEVMLRGGPDTVVRMSHQGDVWTNTSLIRIPLRDLSVDETFVTNGQAVVGEYQNTTTAPEVFLYDSQQNGVRILTRLNPQLDRLTFAVPEKVEWKTSTGVSLSGLLFKPVGYAEHQRYPLVIGTKPITNEFVCDGGEGHAPSFAPQPLAGAGIMYLAQYIGDPHVRESDHGIAAGYPGGVGEAAYQMDIWDSAVTALDEQGLIDPTRVGILGYSRSGWFTEFALTHSSKVTYRAATVTDNVSYSLAEYWLSHSSSLMDSYDAMYGGPPYGSTLKNWVDNSISYNMDKIHTPLLMEQMGYGATYDDLLKTPWTLDLAFGVFSALNHMNRPVELYYYPNEKHQPDDPAARVATLQRNLDWYRFWLQNYERPNPEDPDQYKRWEHLRELRDADAKPN
jgi:dipeptidyl aminopeptidase/acylaminoacyl peptidase